jgi:hypothetical protein
MKRRHVAFLIVWLVFALIFAGLAIQHYNFSKQSYPKFIIQVPQGSNRPEFYSGIAIDTARKFEDFLKKFNAYIDDSNRQSSSTNMLSFYGYLAACLTALVSAIMEFISLKNKKPIVC